MSIVGKKTIAYKIDSSICPIFDINFADRINPDETKVTFNITFNGLGELNQRYFPDVNSNRKKTNR